jgi:hypothetical protein
MVVIGRHDTTDFLERSEYGIYTLSTGGRPGAGEQFLSYDGAEVDSWSLFVVELSDERKSCPALDEIDIKIRIDQMLSH